MIAWLGFGVALADALVLAALAVAAVVAFRKAAPLVAMFGMMGGMMGAGGAAAVTTDAGQVDVVVDRCEYDDHEWFPLDSPSMHGYSGPAHYCGRCGYTERVPHT